MPPSPVLQSQHAVEAIDGALGVIVRRASLPRLHEAIVRRSGVSLERALVLVLGRLADQGPIRLSELAADLAVEPSTVSRQVKQLAGQGLVRRTEDPADRRSALLEITARGRERISRVRRARHEALAALLSSWPEDDRRTLAVLLHRFAGDVARYTDDL